jgi:hypothetical protein
MFWCKRGVHFSSLNPLKSVHFSSLSDKSPVIPLTSQGVSAILYMAVNPKGTAKCELPVIRGRENPLKAGFSFGDENSLRGPIISGSSE